MRFGRIKSEVWGVYELSGLPVAGGWTWGNRYRPERGHVSHAQACIVLRMVLLPQR